ncbi:MAG: neutral zinc metallopeptidase [Gemmatimonadota bacterium]
MRWKQGRRSSNVEDRRGASRPGVRFGGGAVLIMIVLALVFGVDPTPLLQGLVQGDSPGLPSSTGGGIPANDEEAQFISVVLASTEDTWADIFSASGASYAAPTLVLFTDAVRSACGVNSSQTGPFYCPPDQKVYIDLGFFRQLSQMGGSGDFAAAYVLGHEVGHHVQNLLGTSAAVRQAQSRASRVEANQLSVLMELQADCYAGVWAHHAERRSRILEPGDVEEALGAAAAIGDDRLQQRSGRGVQPESFTHGTSEQRAQWLRAGLSAGTLDRCDTFAAAGRQ